MDQDQQRDVAEEAYHRRELEQEGKDEREQAAIRDTIARGVAYRSRARALAMDAEDIDFLVSFLAGYAPDAIDTALTTLEASHNARTLATIQAGDHS